MISRIILVLVSNWQFIFENCVAWDLPIQFKRHFEVPKLNGVIYVSFARGTLTFYEYLIEAAASAARSIDGLR